MRAVRVDFASPPAWPAVTLWAMAALVAVACAWVGVQDLRAFGEVVRAKTATQRLAQQLEARRAAQAALASSAAGPAPFATDAGRLMAWSAVDVAGVLGSIEAAQVTGVKVSQVDVDGPARKVELTLDVVSAQVASAYVQALNAGDEHPAWTLSRVQSQGGAGSALVRGEIR